MHVVLPQAHKNWFSYNTFMILLVNQVFSQFYVKQKFLVLSKSFGVKKERRRPGCHRKQFPLRLAEDALWAGAGPGHTQCATGGFAHPCTVCAAAFCAVFQGSLLIRVHLSLS